ncbi:signal peptide peptidase SppA [Oleiagrimonas sp.]|jgi:protease-4|uniref:signal peptide peptidase SppA n=1 Tax=Oleiagrimonas sp. TaxID=2010330 RepID=UPI002630F8E5|nr:signal peptide peptidase SppA [Oleiagrimonas sp.]MDA3914015.1 signal peptide peptidase SppA [Oleiagrimonas sp.]
MPERTRNGFLAFIALIFRGINLFRLVVLNLVFFLLLLWLILLAGDHPVNIRKQTVLVLHPQGQLVEQSSLDPLQRALNGMSGQSSDQVQVRDLISAINHARTDKRISRILLLPGDLSAGGFAALREVGAAMDRFRASGKTIDVWAPDMDRSQYYLAAHGSHVLLDPMGGLMITGLSSYRLFYKDLFDRIGVNVHLFRVGQYKSADEPYVLDQASQASKTADAYWMGGLWNQWLDDVASQRKLQPKQLRKIVDSVPDRLASTGGDIARLALDDHLVDGLATRQQVLTMLRKQGVPPGNEGHGIRQIDMQQYLKAVSGPTPPMRESVAVVVAQGDIVGGNQGPGRIGGGSTSALLRKARQDKHIKAVVLRVDSPGGEVYAAERIRRQVQLLRKSGKPVVVSMGDVAASGGYWISMDADRIYAEPNTITGSIGIFGLVYNVPDLLSKLSVHSDGVAVGPLADARDITRPLDPQLATLMQARIEKGYRDFVGGVAKARGMTYAQVDAIAQGRVWTGRQALKRGLVDQLGGLRDAVAYAGKKAGLGPNPSVRYLEQHGTNAFQRLLLNFSDSAAAQVLAHVGLRVPRWLAPMMRASGPELHLLQMAKPGKLNVYADCLCTPH